MGAVVNTISGKVDAEIILDTGNGTGSTNTRIRRFSNVRKNTGAAYFTYADDAALGATFTILVAGLYFINYSDAATGTGEPFGVSLNTPSPGTNIDALSYANGKRAMGVGAAGPRPTQIGVQLRLAVNDVIRAHTNGTVNLASDNCIFSLSRIGD